VIIVLRPIGRGNWQPLELEVRRGQEMLFPALRDGEVKPEQRWIIFGREYRVVEIRR
jgi:hypothetical protein